MPSLIHSQESFTDDFPNPIDKIPLKLQLKTNKLHHIKLNIDGKGLSDNEELLKQISNQISRSRKMMVITGAGISCNAGIPDFRSSEGLYNKIKKHNPNVSMRTGQDMFDISLFREERLISVFAMFMDSLHSRTIIAKPTKTHEFIAHLKNRNRLLRCYTQNIDGLEEHLGLTLSKSMDSTISFNSQWKRFDVVQLHGDLNSLACTQCFYNFSWSRNWKRVLKSGELPSCPRCIKVNQERTNLGKRLRTNVGILRPNIVLYGENHPSGEFITQGLNFDIIKGKPDLLLIMGTSLKVDGVKKLIRSISKQVHERSGIVIFINLSNIAKHSWSGIIDYHIESDCDFWVTDLQKRIPGFFLSQQQVDKNRKLKLELRKKQQEQRAKTNIINQDIFNVLDTPNTPSKTPSPYHWGTQIDSPEFDTQHVPTTDANLLTQIDTDFLGPNAKNNLGNLFVQLIEDHKKYQDLGDLLPKKKVSTPYFENEKKSFKCPLIS